MSQSSCDVPVRKERADPVEPHAVSTPAVSRARIYIPLALLIVSLVWGSTYLAIRIAVAGFPPLFMAGARFSLAGAREMKVRPIADEREMRNGEDPQLERAIAYMLDELKKNPPPDYHHPPCPVEKGVSTLARSATSGGKQ